MPPLPLTVPSKKLPVYTCIPGSVVYTSITIPVAGLSSRAQGLDTIHCDDETVQWVRVYNALGQLVLEKEWTENVTQINLSGYAPGVYHILLGGEQRYQSRIIRTQ